MTAYALDALLALFLLSTLTSTLVVLAAIALTGHRSGLDRVRRGTTWDCGCLVQAKTCPDCRADRKHQRQPAPEHGTRHGYQKHRAAGQPPCDDCTTAQADCDRARYQQRKSA